MSDQLFRVVFDGTLTGEFDEAVTKAQFAKLFRLKKKRAESLFSGKDYIIKNNITESVALDFMIKLSEIGCECYVQEVPDEDEPDFDEKRKEGERRMRFRRPPRAGAIVPDRRLRIQRKKDKKYFTDLKSHNYEIPLAFKTYTLDATED